MARVVLQGTTLALSELRVNGEEVTAKLSVKNEYVHYQDEVIFTCEEMENLLACACRLLAGGYEREYSLSFERAGLAVDLYAYTENGKAVLRTVRRQKECVMAVRLLMRSSDKTQFLGGVYTLLLHRKEIEAFSAELSAEYEKNFVQRVHGRGKYPFVGVSPLGYRGCNYLYLDGVGGVKAGDYVWVRMGRHNTEQIVYVDSVHYYGDEDAPYNPQRVKRVLRKASKEEIENIVNEQR